MTSQDQTQADLEKAIRLNEIKHRVDDAVERMWRVDREYASKYVRELQSFYPVKPKRLNLTKGGE